MTKYPEITRALNAPFEPHEVKVRKQAGRDLSYITARTAMNRLDDVFGGENWEDTYFPIENGVVCTLKVTYPDGRVVTKSDAGGHAGMQDQGDDEKSGFSDAFKRAAIKFGVGRYLYRDGVPKVAQDQQGAHREAPAQQQRPNYQERPQAPQQAYPPSQTDGGQAKEYGEPKTGRALFAWTKDQEIRHQVGLLKYINSWAKLSDFPGRMVDWDAEQVALAYAEAERKLATLSVHVQREPGSDDGDDRPY